MGFSPFQLIHEVEAVTPVECEIPSLKIVIHVLPDMTELEESLLQLERLDEQCRDVLTENKTHKNRVKNQYDKSVKPRIFSEGELVLLLGLGPRTPRGREIQVYVVRTLCRVKILEEMCI